MCHAGRPGLTKPEVIEKIGEERWPEFEKWMAGQTKGHCFGCSATWYYHSDVAHFIHHGGGNAPVFD